MAKSQYQIEYSYYYINITSGLKEEQIINTIIENDISCKINTFLKGWDYYFENECVKNLTKTIIFRLTRTEKQEIILRNIKNI